MGVPGEYRRFPMYCFLSKPDPLRATAFLTFYKIMGRGLNV